MTGILLDDNDDLLVTVKKDAQGKITGGLTLGSTTMQDVYMVLKTNQGELKEDPIIGVNLARYIRGKEDMENIRRAIDLGLMRAGIEREDVKNEVQAIINKTK
jgi:hypothetical protein